MTAQNPFVPPGAPAGWPPASNQPAAAPGAPPGFVGGPPASPFPGAPTASPFPGAPAGYPAQGAFPGTPTPGYGTPQQQGPNYDQLLGGLGGADEANTRLPPLPIGGHRRVEVRNIHPFQSRNKEWYVSADFTVMESSNAEPGTRGGFFVKMSPNLEYPDYTGHAHAEIRGLVASCFGLDPNDAQVRASMDADKAGVMSRAYALPRAEVAIVDTTHFQGKKGPGGRYTIRPVGTPVRENVVAEKPAAASAPAQPAAAPFPPHGWQPLPGNPGYWTNGAHTCTEAELRGAVASGYKG